MSNQGFRRPAVAALAFAVGCITINVYFPEAEIKELSERIEEAIQQRAAEGAGGARAARPAAAPARRAGLLPALLRLTAAPVLAQSAEEKVAPPEVTSPAIRKIIESRARRLAELNRLKGLGVVGESKDALVVIRNLDALPDLRARAAAQRLVKEENADREALFKEIAAVKNVDLSQLPRIRETYAVTLRQKARKGDWIQLPDGTWQQKK
ncbi:MAG: DUF1318 domain-containing protein [Acidobacteria bacterium]|nr:MAG: DUF1318 domain-containing protein [Acidobacteriota bacterium]